MDKKECWNCKWYERSLCMRTYDVKRSSTDLICYNWSCEHYEPKEKRLFGEE